MSRVQRVAVAIAAGALVVGALALAGADDHVLTLAALGGGVAVGELLELRPLERVAVPLSYAVVLVLLRVGDAAEIAAVVVVAEVLAALVRPRPWRTRALVLVERLVAIGVAVALYRLVIAIGDPSGELTVLVALALAGAAALAVDEAAFSVRTHHVDLGTRGRSAQLALLSSGMLMAVGYAGLGDSGGMGLWGPLLFSVPLLASWYSFERLAVIRRTYTQTLRALSVVPELGGLVREGHAGRVADLAVTMGRDLGLDARELDYLEAACLLHHIGHVCLDDPSYTGHPIDATEVAQASAEMLRQAEFLAPAAELLSPDPHPFGGGERSWTSVSGQVLRVASAFDELSEGGEARLADGAVEALYSGPGYVYDPRVLAALERVLERHPAAASA